MSDRTLEQWGADAALFGARIGQQRTALKAAASSALDALNASIRARLPGGRMRNVKANGGRVEAEIVSITEARAVVGFRGPANILENGSRPHWIYPRTGQALKLANGKYAAKVHHPGTRPMRVISRAMPGAESDAAEKWEEVNVREFRSI